MLKTYNIKVDQIFAFNSSPNMTDEVKNLPSNFKIFVNILIFYITITLIFTIS